MQVPRQLHAGFCISHENGDGALSYAVDRTLQSVILPDMLIGNRKIGNQRYQEAVLRIFWGIREWSRIRIKGSDDFL